MSSVSTSHVCIQTKTSSVGTQTGSPGLHNIRRRLKAQKEEADRLREALALAEQTIHIKDSTIKKCVAAREDIEGELMEALDNLQDTEVNLEISERELSGEKERVSEMEKKLLNSEEEKKKWIGACCRFQFLASKIKDLLPDSAASGIIECFDYIETPEIDEEMRAEFIVTENSESVVASSLAQDREYYGDGFYLTEELNTSSLRLNRAETDEEDDDSSERDAELGECEIEQLTNLFYELGLESSIQVIRQFEINSISEVREHLRMNWAPFEPGNSEEFGISENTLQVLSEWNQSLTEEESKEIYDQMADRMNDQEFRECLESNEWPEGAVQLTPAQFAELQEWDLRTSRVDINPCRSRSFVIDVNSEDFQELLSLDEAEEETDEYGHIWNSYGLTFIGPTGENQTSRVYDKDDLKAALVIQKFYKERMKKEQSVKKIQRSFRGYLLRRRSQRIRTLRVRARINYKE